MMTRPQAPRGLDRPWSRLCSIAPAGAARSLPLSPAGSSSTRPLVVPPANAVPFSGGAAGGDSVLWTPSIFAGCYMHGEGQVGLFHPFHQLLYRLLPLGTGIQSRAGRQLPRQAFAGTFWFIAASRFATRRRSSAPCCSRSAASTCCTTITSTWWPWSRTCRGCWPRPTCLSWTYGRGANVSRFAAVAVILGSELLLGFPQGVLWNATSSRGICSVSAPAKAAPGRLLPCAAAALGVLLGGVQLLPSADAAAHSTRVGCQRDSRSATRCIRWT